MYVYLLGHYAHLLYKPRPGEVVSTASYLAPSRPLYSTLLSLEAQFRVAPLGSVGSNFRCRIVYLVVGSLEGPDSNVEADTLNVGDDIFSNY